MYTLILITSLLTKSKMQSNFRILSCLSAIQGTHISSTSFIVALESKSLTIYEPVSFLADMWNVCVHHLKSEDYFEIHHRTVSTDNKQQLLFNLLLTIDCDDWLLITCISL